MSEELDSARAVLVSLGIDPDLIDSTAPEDWLRLGTERSLWRSPATLSILDIAVSLGVEEHVARHWWMRYGFADPVDQAIFREDDLNLFRIRATGDAFFGNEATAEFALGFGMALRQIAEGAVALFFNRLGDQDRLPLAQQMKNRTDGAALFKLVLTDAIPTVLYHAFLQAIELRESLYQTWEGEACVGFCDLVGSTSLMNSLESAATLKVLVEFEIAASEIIVRLGGRIVKFVGDEVMWTIANPNGAITVGHELISWVAQHPPLVSARVGISLGEVIQRDGDLFGPTVNRAARLASHAEGGEMIVDAALMPNHPSEDIIIKGIANPVPVRSVKPAPS